MTFLETIQCPTCSKIVPRKSHHHVYCSELCYNISRRVKRKDIIVENVPLSGAISQKSAELIELFRKLDYKYRYSYDLEETEPNE